MSIPSAGNRRLTTGSVMLATIMYSLDSTIANVALPHIRGSVSATSEQIAWILTSYMVAMAIMTPLTGWLSTRFGRKQLLLWSIAGFTIMSAACGISVSLSQIVIFRTLQGLCGAALVPLSQAMLLDIYPAEDHGRAMAIWVAGIMVAPILGPILGGWLTDNASWRWIFYINLPVGILAFLGVKAFATESKTHAGQAIDLFGYGFLALGIGSLQLMLDRGQLLDWFASKEIIAEATIAGFSLYLVAVHTATASKSFINRELLCDRNFVLATLAGSITTLLFYATLALVPTMLQDLLRYPAVTAGIAMAPRGVGTLIASLIVGRLIKHVDVRLLLAIGFILQCVAQIQMGGFTLSMDIMPVIWSGVIQGLGIGFCFVPMSSLAFATLQSHLRTEGAAINTMVRTIGGSVGISITQALLIQNTQRTHATMIERLRPDNPLTQPPYLAAPYSLSDQTGIAVLNQEVTRQATMISYINDYRNLALLALVLLATALLLRKRSVNTVQTGQK